MEDEPINKKEKPDPRLVNIINRLSKIENFVAANYQTDRLSVLEQLSISPKTLLIFITLLNVALFIGGTVYTGVQVDSIQKRYEAAAIKISEAQQKYNEALLSFQTIESIANKTKIEIVNIEKQLNELIESSVKKSKELDNEIVNFRGRADQHLEMLNQRSAMIISTMDKYKEKTESALQIAANSVANKLESEIILNKEAIEKKQSHIDELGLQIEGLSIKVDEKSLDIVKIQDRIENQLNVVNKLNNEYKEKIKSIKKSNKITIPIAYSITDIWLKLLIILPLIYFVFASIGYFIYKISKNKRP
jgi:hypothetical protein